MTTQREWREGRALLEELLPEARTKAATREDSSVEKKSGLAEGMSPYVKEENFDAILIYPGPRGGWHADLVLKNVPAGVPNVMGTPVAEPLRTREEAEERAKQTLIIACVMSREEKVETPPSFLLDDYTLPLYPALLEAMDKGNASYGSPLQASAQIEQVLDDLCPGGFDGNAFSVWPEENQAKLIMVVHRAAVSGLFAYPMRRDAPPPDEGES